MAEVDSIWDSPNHGLCSLARSITALHDFLEYSLDERNMVVCLFSFCLFVTLNVPPTPVVRFGWFLVVLEGFTENYLVVSPPGGKGKYVLTVKREIYETDFMLPGMNSYM